MSREELMFYKMSGAGNDFIVIDALDKAVASQVRRLPFSREEFTRRVCQRGLSVGADGVVFLQPAQEDNHFSWDFYNSDGSRPEMCGNAARCVASLVFQKGYFPTQMRLETQAGVIEAQYMPDKTVRVLMVSKNLKVEQKKVLIDGEAVSGFAVNTGVPHFVIEENIQTAKERKSFSRKIRTHTDFGSAGTNVTYFETQVEGVIASVSYERGVEDFTLACGTGAVAAALAFAKQTGFSLEHELLVRVPGGDLFVSVDAASGRPFLRGPAVITYVGHLNIGAVHGAV